MAKVFSDPVVKFFVSAVGVVVIFITLMELQHIFIPLVIAYFLFFMFEPLNNFLRKYRIPYWLTIILNLIIVIGIVFGISRVIIDSFSNLVTELPFYEQKLNNLIRRTAVSFGVKDPVFTRFRIDKILTTVDYGVIAEDLFSSTISIFTSGFFVLFFFIFVSTGHNKIIEAFKHRFVEKNIKDSIKKIKKELKKKEEESLIPLDELEKIEEENQKKRNEELIEKTFRD
ncbi:MAG TPA: hypothetical protein DIW31_00400, partial [Bacteroidales bacterium]|nr:hypothetical protein [Bacteroidales bacterium]